MKFLADYSDSLKDAVKEIPHNTGDADTITTVLNFAYTIAGLVAVAVLVYAGVSYATSGGEPGKTKKASQAMVYALIGLVIVLLAAVITNFVAGKLN